MKKVLSLFVAMCLLFCLFACNNPENETSNSESDSESASNSTSQSESISDSQSASESNSSSQSQDSNVPTIYLAGDSTVKTYGATQYIGGWGQYLANYLNSDVKVVNASEGGRSSRSFINEGRLYPVEGGTRTAISASIKAGDYLFIQFGHNDDETNGMSNMIERQVPLGTPDQNGIYPTTAGVEVPTTSLPTAYTGSDTTSQLTKIKSYGSTYYSYDCGGTYKWFLKQYIDFAREKGVTPVLITPVSRVKFSGEKIIAGNGRFGEDFAYIKAVRQLASEENCLLIDLHAETIKILEAATSSDANYLMALKPNGLMGEWPTGYDTAYNNTAAGYTGIEGTHYNKFGAFITSAVVAEKLYGFVNDNTTAKNGEKIGFGSSILTTPTSFIVPSTKLSLDKLTKIKALFSTMKIIAD